MLGKRAIWNFTFFYYKNLQKMENTKTINKSPGQGELLSVMGIDITVKLSGEDTGNAYSIVELNMPPNNGPGMHIDTRWDESWYVIEGTFAFCLDGEQIEAVAGNFAYAQKGIPHSFRNIGQTVGKIMMIAVPAGVEKFFQDVHRATLEGKTEKETMLNITRSHGIESIPKP